MDSLGSVFMKGYDDNPVWGREYGEGSRFRSNDGGDGVPRRQSLDWKKGCGGGRSHKVVVTEL